jgi:hypothetical protein
MERNRIPIKKFEINISDHISDSSIKNSYLPYIQISFADRDPGWKNPDPGSGMEKSRSGIRDKDPGSATVLDPQH